MIIATKSSASTIESSSRMPNARRRRNSSERKVSVLGDIVGRGGVPGGGVSRATLAMGQARGGSHKTPPPGAANSTEICPSAIKGICRNTDNDLEVEPVQTAGKFQVDLSPLTCRSNKKVS